MAVDRGGLKHVIDMTYMLCTTMEQALRPHICTEEKSALPDIADLSEAIKRDDDVLFYWSILSTNWEDEADILLSMIVEHWIKLRVFSHASAFVEKYKQSSKKNI